MNQLLPTRPGSPVGRCMLGALVVLGLSSCVESTVQPELARALAEEAASTSSTEQTVEVQTRFVVEGLDEMATQVQLDRVYLHVGALVLEPVSDDGAVSFASRQPFALEFDIARGEVSLAGPTMELPYGGEFAVVVQVEPSQLEQTATKNSDDDVSVEVEGRWFYSDDFDGVAPRADEPSPLPWREADKKGNDDAAADRTFLQQREFAYRAADVARLHLTEIRLDEAGEYELTLTLRLDSWLERDVLPVLAELGSLEASESSPADVPEFEATDGEDELDDVIDGTVIAMDGLVGDIEASTARQ